MIRPEAVATISTLPKHAQARATQNNAMTVPLVAPAIGGGGVSTISSAAGRKASSSLRVDGLYRRGTPAFERFAINPPLGPGGRLFPQIAAKSPWRRPPQP